VRVLPSTHPTTFSSSFFSGLKKLSFTLLTQPTPSFKGFPNTLRYFLTTSFLFFVPPIQFFLTCACFLSHGTLNAVSARTLSIFELHFYKGVQTFFRRRTSSLGSESCGGRLLPKTSFRKRIPLGTRCNPLRGRHGCGRFAFSSFDPLSSTPFFAAFPFLFPTSGLDSCPFLPLLSETPQACDSLIRVERSILGSLYFPYFLRSCLNAFLSPLPVKKIKPPSLLSAGQVVSPSPFFSPIRRALCFSPAKLVLTRGSQLRIF